MSRKQAEVYYYDIEVFPNCFMVAVIPQHKSGEGEDEYAGPWVCTVHEANPNWRDEFLKTAQFFNASHRWFAGYNSYFYDDPIMNYVIKNAKSFLEGSAEGLAGSVYRMSKKVIGGDRSHRYDVPFGQLDLMKINGLQKSLKLVAVNLKWPLIADLPFGPHYHVQAEDLAELKRYNINDVQITEKLYEESRSEINLRSYITSTYKVDVMTEPRSGVANRLMESFYGKATGQSKWDFKDERTPRKKIKMEDVILPNVKFSTPKMKKFLARIKKKTLSESQKFEEHVLIGRTPYKIASGGLHSEREGELFESSDKEGLVDVDVSSYYPNIMLLHSIKPEHLSPAILEVLREVTEVRLEAKRTYKTMDKKARKEGRELTGEEKKVRDVAKAKSDALKIVINSIFGKTGSEHHWLYDMLAMYRVTINGQLYLLMLIEALEKNGFEVFYANTDGVTAKVPPEKAERFEQICRFWEKYTRFELEYANYKKMLVANVNVYIVEMENGMKKRKGTLDYKRAEDVNKGFDKPIVPLAIEKFFFEGVPFKKTLEGHKDLYDFCMSERPDKKFQMVYEYVDGEGNAARVKREKIQRTNRYFVSKTGGRLIKTTEAKELTVSGTKGVHVRLLNEPFDADLKDVDMAYYLKECKKIAAPFDQRQLSMF